MKQFGVTKSTGPCENAAANTNTEAARCEKRPGADHVTSVVFTAALGSGCGQRSCFAAAAVGKLAGGQAKCYTAQC